MSRVLVIDDNLDLLELMQVILTVGGYTVEIASSGSAGVRAAKERSFDLVITDLFMPNQDGIETIGLIRAALPDLKVLAVSGGGRLGPSPSYLMTAMQIGADAALAKPFDPEALLTATRSLIGPGAQGS